MKLTYTVDQAAALKIDEAAKKEGVSVAEYIRRAVAARMAGTTSTAGPSLGTTAQLQTAAAALIAAQELVEVSNAENAAALKKQVDRLSNGLGQLGEIATMLERARS